MILNKQVRLYLIAFKDHGHMLCPAQSAEHAKTLTASTGEAEIFYLGWTEMKRSEKGYEVSKFSAQENAELLTGEELTSYQYDGKTFPKLEKDILAFLEEYYRDERTERLEAELQAWRTEFGTLQEKLDKFLQK